MARARLDLDEFQGGEPLNAKALACEAAHHRTVYHGAAQSFFVDLTDACKVTHEAAREAVAGASGVVHFLQGERRNREKKIAAHEEGAVFAPFDDEKLWPHAKNVLGGAGEVVLA